ncbi:MAG: SGNH/GDSL hydrolase family protein, partial [Planctomycetota bacterium]
GERYDLRVVASAKAGARVSDALNDPSWEIPETGGVLLVELGGNDMLGNTNVGAFRSRLRTLLGRLNRRVSDRGGRVVVVGLPLPPLHAAYGRAQRDACRSAGVLLIPRHVLADVLFAPNATIDSLHLSPSGHEAMAEAIWRQLGDCLPAAGQQ